MTTLPLLLAAIIIFQEHDETRIHATETVPTTIALASIEAPRLTQKLYAVTGEVKYSGVSGGAYLETWNVFPTLGRAFSRTLAEGGPFGKIQGNSAWRTFALPFDASGASEPPSALEFNLVLPRGGNVTLRHVRLVEFPPGTTAAQTLALPGRPVQEIPLTPPREYEGSATAPKAWWNDRTAGLIGGIGGALLGFIGAVLGVMARRQRRAVIRWAWGMSIFGGLLLIAGLAALAARQPYAVYYPLLLAGLITGTVFGANAALLARQTRQEELRRISALDA